jgi:glycosyltransferase involved in cell wall biosynthesis
MVVRIVLHSNAPWNNSGYGIEIALLIPRIKARTDHEIVAISSPYSFAGSPLEWDDIPVLGAARDPAGCDTILRTHEYFTADWTIVLADPFGLVQAAKELRQIDLALWFPVDCDPLGKGDVTVLRESGAVPIAMSGFGQHVLLNEGAESLYVPLAVDTGIFQPGDPHIYRDSIPAIDDDTFVIGICAMNRDMNRKGFHEQLIAFAGFHAKHPNSILAIHSTQQGHPGLNLNGMTVQLGITDATVFPDPYIYDAGLVNAKQMAVWYNGLDVLSMCSYGEGFGLPLMEAQACGIPVITTNASSMSELCGGGWLVSGTPFWTDGHQSWWKRPDISDIEQAYEIAWEARENGTLPKKPARDFALLYDADRVFEQYWVPCLDELEKLVA